MIITYLLRLVTIYVIIKKEDHLRIEQIKKKTFDGIVTDYLFTNEKEGFDYVTGGASVIFGKYFFENNKIKNLQIEDSVSKIQGELVLKIYRKDENGKYEYIGKSR